MAKKPKPKAEPSTREEVSEEEALPNYGQRLLGGRAPVESDNRRRGICHICGCKVAKTEIVCGECICEEDGGVLLTRKTYMSDKTEQPNRRIRKDPSFVVDDKIYITLDSNLAIVLGDFLIEKKDEVTNPAVVALGYRLQAISPPVE